MSRHTAASAAALDAAFVRARRIKCDLSLQTVADAVGLSPASWRRIENGPNTNTLTLGQLGALAPLLGVEVTDLLATADPTDVVEVTEIREGTQSMAEPLEQRLGSLLLVAGRAVPIGTLAAVLGATTDDITAAVDALRRRLGPAGLVLSIGKPGVTLVPDRGSLRDAAVREVLRRADQRGALTAAAGRLLHRLARGQSLPQSPKRDERARLAALHRGRWIAPGSGTRAAEIAEQLHPDVRFSLALDDGYACVPAAATTKPVPQRRSPLPWLDDAVPDPAPDSQPDTRQEAP